MADDLPLHLGKRATALLDGSLEDKLAHVNRKVWIPYAEGDAALAAVQKVIDHPRENRMPCLLLVAVSNNGKSTVLSRAITANAPVSDARGNKLTVPALQISAPPSAEEEEFFSRIVLAFGALYNPSDRTKMLRYQAETLLEEYKVKALLIDEFNLIGRGTPNAQAKFLSRIRIMSADRQMSIVGAGVRESINFLNMDGQFATRFTIAPLRKWLKDRRTKNLLASLQADIPLPERSDLDKSAFADRMVEESEGTIGDLVELAKAIASFAIASGKSRMTVGMIDEIQWVRPSRRVVEANKALDGL